MAYFSAKHDLVYVHLTKCAGNSMGKFLKRKFRASWDRSHTTARQFRRRREKLWERAFTFAIIRNPFDKTVSQYHYLRSGSGNAQFAKARGRSFDEWVLQCLASPRKHTTWDDRLTPYVVDDDGEIMVDCLIRYEDMDLTPLEEHFGVPFKLPHLNGSTHRDYRDYYGNAEVVRAVERHFARDLELFGYSLK